MKNYNMRYYFPIGLLIFIFLDGSLSNVFAREFFTGEISIESLLVLLWLVMAIFYGEVDRLMLWAFVAGLIFDMYYTGILGIYMIIFPLVVYLNRQVCRFFTSSFLVVLLIYLIDLTLVSALAFLANSLIGLANISLADFFVADLGPTLAYNLAWFAILYLPIKNFFEKFS